MNREDLIQNEINKTMEMADRFDNIDENPFLYTKISASLNQQDNTINKRKKLQPVFIILIIMLNILTIVTALQYQNNYQANPELTTALINKYQIKHTQHQNIIVE